MCGSDIFLQDGNRKNITNREKNYMLPSWILEKLMGVNWLALWYVLKICGVGRKLLNAIKSFCGDASTYLRISGETSKHLEIKVGLRQLSCHHLCSVFMWMREMQGRVKVYTEGRKWGLNSILFAHCRK